MSRAFYSVVTRKINLIATGMCVTLIYKHSEYRCLNLTLWSPTGRSADIASPGLSGSKT